MDKMKPLGSHRRRNGSPGGLLGMLLIVLLVAVVVGAVALSFVDVPAPTTRIEQIVPNDRTPAA